MTAILPGQPTPAPTTTDEHAPVVDEISVVTVPDEPAARQPITPSAPEQSWFPPGMAARLTVVILGSMVAALFAIALPLLLTGTSAAGAFGIAALPAFWCGAGFGAIFGAASFGPVSDD